MQCVAILLALVAVAFATKSVYHDYHPRVAHVGHVGRIYGDNVHPLPYKRGYQSIGVAAFQDADEDGIPDLQDGDLNNDGIMDRTVKNDAYLNAIYGRRAVVRVARAHPVYRTRGGRRAAYYYGYNKHY